MKTTDDFLWSEYTDRYYNKQVNEMLAEDIDFLIKKSFLKKKKIVWKDNIHPFNKVIYEKIVKLNVKSVFECGCAGGHHIYNIKKLLPDIKVSGCELLQSQVDKMSEVMKIPKSIVDDIRVFDFIEDTFVSNKGYDFVFTNAVTMHLGYDRAVQFIKNMAAISKKYIYLSEDIGQHDYPALFKEHLPEWKVKQVECGYFLKREK